MYSIRVTRIFSEAFGGSVKGSPGKFTVGKTHIITKLLIPNKKAFCRRKREIISAPYNLVD